MAFMLPEYEHGVFWRVTFPGDVQLYQGTLWGTREKVMARFTHAMDAEPVHGWFCRLSAPGYLDATDWAGPFETEAEARAYIRETYDVDDETGDDLEDEP